MPSQSLSLDTLPVEIIRRIAAYGPCESALALLKVNRALHRACNDHLVFKSIIDNASGILDGKSVWACKALSLDSSTSAWARYALADSRVAQISSREPRLTHDDFVKNGAPQLMAAYHPLIDRAVPDIIYADLQALQSDPARSQDAQALSFCLAARIMSRKFFLYHLAPPRPATPISLVYIAFRNSLVPVLRRALFEPAHAFSITPQYPDTVAQKHAVANQAVAIFSLDLRAALATNRVRPFSFPLAAVSGLAAAQAPLHPPLTTDIPFLSFMDLPLPFSAEGGAAEFGTGHLAAMTSAAFLEDGEWVGYYCMSISQAAAVGPRVLFDPPMTGMRFVTSRRAVGAGAGAGVSGPALSLAADGVDGVGGFRLVGEIDLATGRVVMRKQYNYTGALTTAWDWCCLMTPFGIVGSWGGSTYGGWIWLWKENWMNSDLGAI